MCRIDLNQLASAGKSLTASSAAWLVAYFPHETQWPEGLRHHLLSAVTGACQASRTSNSPATDKKRDPSAEQRLQSYTKESKIRLFTDYPEALKMINLPERVEMVDSEEECDFSLTMKHIKSFPSIPIHRRVNQFPYEGGLVRKDLLPLTVRRYCYKNGVAPNWWLPCFDLSTEFHLFYESYNSNVSSGSTSNMWIIKPSQGSRGLGHQIVSEVGVEGLSTAAALSPIFNEDLLLSVAGDVSNLSRGRATPFDGGDRVAQLLVDRPLLVNNRKFDIRCFVFVRSFEPFEAYMHHCYYARLANKPYSLDQLHDPTVSITVCAYDEDEAVASLQERLLNEDLLRELELENPGIRYKDMEGLTFDMLCDLFGGAAASIGEWPQSAAYYSIDVVFEDNRSTENANEPFTPQPKLLEVNFMGDWHGVEAAVKSSSDYQQWVDDLVTVLATRDNVEQHPRLKRLKGPA